MDEVNQRNEASVIIVCTRVWQFQNKKEKEREKRMEKKDDKGGKGFQTRFWSRVCMLCTHQVSFFCFPYPTPTFLHHLLFHIVIKTIHGIIHVKKSILAYNMRGICINHRIQCISPFCFPAQACPIPLFARQKPLYWYPNDILSSSFYESKRIRQRIVSIGGSRQSATRVNKIHDTPNSPIVRILCGTIKKSTLAIESRLSYTWPNT